MEDGGDEKMMKRRRKKKQKKKMGKIRRQRRMGRDSRGQRKSLINKSKSNQIERN